MIFYSCTKPEQKPNIQAGRLQKDIKSVEQRAEQDIKRLTDKLKKAEVTKPNFRCFTASSTEYLVYMLLSSEDDSCRCA